MFKNKFNICCNNNFVDKFIKKKYNSKKVIVAYIKKIQKKTKK